MTTSKPGSRLFLGLSTAVLLVGAVELGAHADALSIWPDETWSIFHAGKSIRQILLERDLLWPFGYYLALHGWTQIVGSMNDFAMHAVGVFTGLLSSAFLIRAGRELRIPSAGFLAAFAFGTSSYAIYFSLEIRGYALTLLLESAFICLYLRWLNEPSSRRSLPLLFLMLVMPYVHFILGVVIALATVHLLITKPKYLGRWAILIALMGIAFLPLLPQAWRGFELASASASAGPLPSLYRLGLDSWVRAHSAHWDLWFAALLACCALGLHSAARRIGWKTLAWLLVWAVGIPLAAFAAREHFGFFTTRYLVFTLPAAVLLLGIGLAASPTKWIGIGALGIMALAPWQPFDHRPAYSDFPPLRDFMRQMADSYLPGDRLVVDPWLAPLTDTLEWSYYKSVYFRHGDFRLGETTDGRDRRIWYLSQQGKEDPALKEWVWGGRVLRTYWGPWYLHASLLEAPPDDLGTRVGENLRFLGADVDRLPDVHAGDLLPVRLWWAADLPTPSGFSVSLALYDSSGQPVVDAGGPREKPEGAPPLRPLSPGEILLDSRQVRVPYHVDDGIYTLVLTSEDPLRPIAGLPLEIDRFHLASFATW